METHTQTEQIVLDSSIGFSFTNMFHNVIKIKEFRIYYILGNQLFKLSNVNFNSTENSVKEVDFSQANTVEAASFN